VSSAVLKGEEGVSDSISSSLMVVLWLGGFVGERNDRRNKD